MDVRVICCDRFVILSKDISHLALVLSHLASPRDPLWISSDTLMPPMVYELTSSGANRSPPEMSISRNVTGM